MNITDYLPLLNNLNNEGNILTSFINDTIGMFLEKYEDTIGDFNYEIFIQNATGIYLDLYGKDYNVPRLVDETDEHYRKRLITIQSKRFTANTIYNEYDLQLLTYTDPTVTGNTLLSDNHFLNNKYYIECDDIVWETLIRKYVVNIERLEL